jgi:hypothetical protein
VQQNPAGGTPPAQQRKEITQVLLDRKRVKFWQKWVFLGMAILMASFLIFGYSGLISGNNSSPSGQGTNVAATQLQDLKKQLAAKPNDLTLLLELGNTYQVRATGDQNSSPAQTSDYKQAASYYQRWLTVQAVQTGASAIQARAGVLLNLATVYNSLADYTQAVSTYSKLTELYPKNADYFAAMGQAALNGGDKKTAMLAFSRYLVLDPQGTDAAAIRAWINSNGGQAPSPTPSGSAKP